MSSVARDKNKDTGVETESSTTTQLMMKDNGKVYSLSTTTFMGVNYTSEFYFETGEEKNYIYNKNKDGNWTKNEDLSGMSFDYRDTAVGFTEGLEAVKASYTIDAQGYYFAENVTYQVSPQSLVNQIGSIHYKDYTCTQESVTFSNEYIKIGITNNHLSYYEAKSHSVRMVEDAEAKTLTFMPNEYSTAVTRLHNIRDIGTTVVTLPIVE